MPTPSDPPITPVPPKGGLRRRVACHGWCRRTTWAVRVILFGVLGLVASWAIVTQTPVAKRLVLPRVSKALGMTVLADHVTVDLDGTVHMSNVRVRVPGVPGLAGRFLHMRSMRAWVDWGACLKGRPTVTRIAPDTALVRFSLSRETGALNVGSLPEAVGGDVGAGASAVLPRVDPFWVRVELGEHAMNGPGKARYTALRSMRLKGSLIPAGDGAGAYIIRLKAEDQVTGIEGRIDHDGVRATLSGVSLAEWSAGSTPSAVRDFFDSLNLAGETRDTTFRYLARPGPSGEPAGLTAEVQLAGVAMNVPGVPRMTPEGELEDEGEPMRLSQVDGRLVFRSDGISADLRGMIEDLPATVSLEWRGLALDSAFSVDFSCENFKVERNPKLLPFAPRIVRERLGTFSNPTGELSAEATVSRGPPTPSGPGEITQSGRITISRTSAAFRPFPYPFEDLEGVVEFDEKEIRILRVEGRSSSGARLTATGYIRPPTDGAEVHIDVQAVGIAIDDRLREALGSRRGPIIDALFSASRHRELVDRGLLTPEEFAPGGLADLDVRVRRELGEHGEWTHEVDVRLHRINILAERFPAPIVGEDAILNIRGDSATLAGGVYHGLRGGRVVLEADVDLSSPDPGPEEDPEGDGRGSIRPEIRVAVTDAPLDDLLINALPGSDVDDEHNVSAKRVLRELGSRARGDATARVFADEHGELQVEADITVREGAVRAPPRAGEAPMGVRDVAGRIGIRPGAITMDLAGVADGPGPASGSTVRLVGRLDPSGGGFETNVTADRVDLTWPLATLAGVFADEAESAIRGTWEKYSPTGVCAGTLTASRAGRDATTVTVDVSALEDGTGRVLGGAVSWGSVSGGARIVADESGARAELDDLRADIAFQGEPSGRMRLDGVAALSPGATGRTMESDLRATLEDGRFDSALFRAAAREFAGAELAQVADQLSPWGLFEVDISVMGPPDIREFSAELRPRSLGFLRGGEPVVLPLVSGAAYLRRDGGELVGVRGLSSTMEVGVDAEWRADDAGALSWWGTISASAGALEGEARRVLPLDVEAFLVGLGVRGDGPVEFGPTNLALVRSGREAPWSVVTSGVVRAEGITLNPGVEIENAQGEVSFRFQSLAGDRPTFDADVEIDSARVLGVRTTGGVARIISGEDAGELIVPAIRLDCHDGRVTGDVHVRPTTPGDPRAQEYLAEFELSGVRLSPALGELRERMGASKDGPDVGGEVNARLSLTGTVGQEADRRGRGALEIGGGKLVSMPLILSLIEMSNLVAPSGAELEYARASVFVDGHVVGFEDISIESSAVSLRGFGTMTWPGRELDLRFTSKAQQPIPLLGAVVSGLRNRLVTTSVRGRLEDPRIGLEQLPGPWRMTDRASRLRSSAPEAHERWSTPADRGRSGDGLRVDTIGAAVEDPSGDRR